MAEATNSKTARARRTAAESKLERRCNTLLELCAADDGTKPTIIQVRRHLTEITSSMDKYEDAHSNYTALLEEDELVQWQDAFTKLFAKVEKAMDDGHTVIEEREAAAAISAEKAGQETFIVDETKLAFTLNQRNLLSDRIEQSLASVEKKLQGDLGSIEAIKAQEDIMVWAEHLAEEISGYTLLLNEIHPQRGEEFQQYAGRKRCEIDLRVAEIRDHLAACKASLGQARIPQGAGSARSGQQFERAPLPKFSGESRDFPSFRREWKGAVQQHLEPANEVRQFKAQVPLEIRNDLKNLLTMEECWTALNDKYGDPLIAIAEYVGRLDKFQYSRPGLPEHAKFKELHNAWHQAVNDMQELGAVEQLGQSTILAKIVQKLPSKVQQGRYVTQRIDKLLVNSELIKNGEQPKYTELQIMRDFMKSEKRQMEHLELLAPAKEETGASAEARRPERRRDRSPCLKCGGPHQPADCAAPRKPSKVNKVSKVNANMLVKPKECPACKGQHTMEAKDGRLLLFSFLLRVELAICGGLGQDLECPTICIRNPKSEI
jgi:hypothetical protein